MRGNRFSFYATKKDWEKVLEIVENDVPIKYVKAQIYENKNDIVEYKTLLEHDGLGISTDRQAIGFGFVVVKSDLAAYVEVTNNNKGEERYIVGSQIFCPDSIILKPGGIYKDTHFVYGEIDTVSKTDISQMIFKKFKSAFRKTCRNWHGRFIGKDAETYYPKLQFSPYDGYPWDIFK